MNNKLSAAHLLAFTLLACAGEESSDTGATDCAATLPFVVVSVVDPDGVPIEGATVKWDNVACPESPGGTYGCAPEIGGSNNLSVLAMNMRTYSNFETLPEPSCRPLNYAIDVELQPGIS